MSNRVDWAIAQSNQATLTGQVLKDDDTPLDLTAYTLSLVIKPTETSPDSAGTTYTPTITAPTLGEWQLVIAGTAFATPAVSWYRMDVVDGATNHVTALLGASTVFAA